MERGKMVGTVFEEIILKNEWDVGNALHGLIKASEVRQTTVPVVVDTGAATLIINEAVRQELGLALEGTRESTLANGEVISCGIAEAVRVCWKNRDMTCRPWVVPGAKIVLLGAIPLEDMDLMVDPKNRKLVGVHGDEPLGMLY
jgi:clan AA aspartic protease